MTMQPANTAVQNGPLLVTVPEAARILDITRSAAYRCVAAGELESTRLAGRLYVLTSSIATLTAPQ